MIAGIFTLVAGACTEPGTNSGLTPDPSPNESSCIIPRSQIFRGASGKDAIPALTDPVFVRPGQAGSEYLRDQDRVIGLLVGDEVLAIPLNIMWWHEIVNLHVGGLPVAITHCPLTGSSLGFDRAAVGGAEFGVSGLLYQNNLIMYDRTGAESLWPQMIRGARCGERTGTPLVMVPLVEMTWKGWRELHPETRVLSSHTGLPRDYQEYPYGTYDQPDNPFVLFPQEVDTRFPPKERALGIPDGIGGLVFPFSRLDESGPVTVARVELREGSAVVFWDRDAQGAMAYRPVAGGQVLSFRVTDGGIFDDQTGTRWRLDGTAAEGALVGDRLEPVAEAFVAYWFAWPAFHPLMELWGDF